MTVAAVDEIPRSRRMPTDHRPLTAIRLVAPHAGLVAVQQIGQHRAVSNIGRRRYHRMDQLAAAVDPKCPFIPKYHWLPFFV
jgi:hypothetical protein